MCPSCYRDFVARFDAESLQTMLDGFDVPVIVVEEDMRVVASNRAAQSLFGRPTPEVVGLLGGEALECAYARLPAGCGRTQHCSSCAIRGAVNRTIASGVPQQRVAAEVTAVRGGPVLQVFVTTSLVGELVRVVVELR